VQVDDDGRSDNARVGCEEMILWRKEVEDLIGREEYYRIENETVER